MKAFKIAGKYRALQPELKAFRKDRTLIGEKPISQWMADLQAIAEVDSSGDAARSSTGCQAALLLLLAFVLVFVAAFMENYWVGVAAGVAALFAVLMGVMAMYLKRFDYPDRLREVVTPFIAALAEDMRPDDLLNLEIDLHEVTTDANEVNFEKVDPGRRKYPKIKTWFYEFEWLRGRAILADRSILDFSVRDAARKVTATRQRPGKIKTKTKYKTKHLVNCSLSVKGDRYAPGEGVDPHKDKGSRLVMRSRGKFKSSGSDCGPMVEDLLSVPADLFSKLQGANP